MRSRRALLWVILLSPAWFSPAPRAAAGAPGAGGRVHRVGPGRALPRIGDAARAVRDGDTVEIDAGVYPGDVAVWTRDDLTIRAVGGVVHIPAAGAHAQGKGIWVVRGRNTRVEGVEFSGVRVPDGNGAGIRHEGTGLALLRCRFWDNQNGLLTAPNPLDEVVIERCEFADNGAGDGRTHNIYIGGGRRFTLRFSYVHRARVGHDVKTRAAESFILCNRIMDEREGRSSYSIDLSNGGLAFVIGNLIQQGANAENSVVVSYGAEGLRHQKNRLYFVHNTVVNEFPRGGIFVAVRASGPAARIVNNLFVGRGTLVSGPAELSHNLLTDRPGLVDVGNFDYRPARGSPAIDAGTDPGSVEGVALLPACQYRHPADGEPRVIAGRPDIGAYEYHP